MTRPIPAIPRGGESEQSLPFSYPFLHTNGNSAGPSFVSHVMVKERSIGRRLVQPFLFAILLATAARLTGLQAYSIPSRSMWPALEPGDHILVTTFRFATPRRGDIVVFRSPVGSELLIKRVIGVPGDHVELAQGVRINGLSLIEPYAPPSATGGSMISSVIGPDNYFVLGDNRNDSLDSRSWGTVPRDDIIGKARWVFWSDGETLAASPVSAWAARPRPAFSSGIRWSRLFTSIR